MQGLGRFYTNRLIGDHFCPWREAAVHGERPASPASGLDCSQALTIIVENQLAPACERLFTERGIPVRMVSQRVIKRLGGELLEIDVLVVNQGHVVAVEVKASLNSDDVRAFLEDLRQFRTFFPEYADWQVHGAVAGIRIEDGADRYA